MKVSKQNLDKIKHTNCTNALRSLSSDVRSSTVDVRCAALLPEPCMCRLILDEVAKLLWNAGTEVRPVQSPKVDLVFLVQLSARSPICCTSWQN
jgi:hypothetical protein